MLGAPGFDIYDVGSVGATGKEMTQTKSSRGTTLYTVELFVSSPLAMVQQNMQCMDHWKAGNIKKTSVCKVWHLWKPRNMFMCVYASYECFRLLFFFEGFFVACEEDSGGDCDDMLASFSIGLTGVFWWWMA